MSYVDAHFHIWDLTANYYPWLTDRVVEKHVAGDYASIRKNYLLADYFADSSDTPVVKGVHVQAEHDPSDPVRETRWLQNVADAPDSRGFPQAIVAHAPLERPNAERQFEAHCAHPNMRGLRQVLPADVLTDAVFRDNLALLPQYKLSFDLRVRHPEMAAAAGLASNHPDVQFIVTHIGYRMRQDADYVSAWRRGMRQLAERDNVSVKLSGFGFIDPHWTVESIRPMVLETIEIFGPSRCMFASDFPVDRIARDYRAYWSAYETIVAAHSADEQRAMLGANAERIYRI